MEVLVIRKFCCLFLAVILSLQVLMVPAIAGAEFGTVKEEKPNVIARPSLVGNEIKLSRTEMKLTKNSKITTRPELQEEKTYYSDTIQVLVTKRIKTRIEEKLADYEKEIEMLAKVVYKEAGGIKWKHHKAAVVWCVLNRLDSGIYGDSMYDIIVQPNAFAYYPETKVREEFVELVIDVMTRWLLEHEGYTEVGRVLSSEYIYFHGADGVNKFKKKVNDRVYWDWSLESPYAD